MIRVRRLCIRCGRHYTYESSANIAEDDPGCPDCEPENHDHIDFDPDA